MENKVTIEAFKKSLPEFISLFETDKISKEYFKYEIDTLNNVTAKLEEGKVEIAVVGITSTGKSTMLNAILGENLLPESPTPCTGVQVTCSYGETTKAIIDFYPDKKKRRKVVTSKIVEELFKFGDEKGNPKNKKGVMEIKLFSSNFKLNKNIVLIDTPGSDAADLESHEEITFKVVLPSAGIVMFLSTVKPISSEQNLQFIDRILSVSDVPIPFLAVLNMKDAAAPKKKSGRVEKTQAEVLEEHIKKYRHLLSKCSSKFVQEATIVPISAKMAKQADDNKNWQESGMKELEEAVNNIIQTTIERRTLLEIERTKKKFNELKNNLKESEEQKEGLEREGLKIQKYKKEYQDIEIFIKNTERKIDGGYAKIRQKARELKEFLNGYLIDGRHKLIHTTTPWGVSEALKNITEEIKNRVYLIENKCKKIEEIKSKIFNKLNIQIKEFCKNFEISLKDLQKSGGQSFNYKIKIEMRPKYLKESYLGCLGKAIDGRALIEELEKLDKKLKNGIEQIMLKVKEEVHKKQKCVEAGKEFLKIEGLIKEAEKAMNDKYGEVKKQIIELKEFIERYLWNSRTKLVCPPLSPEHEELDLGRLNKEIEERVSSIKDDCRKQERIPIEFIDGLNLKRKGLLESLDILKGDINRPVIKYVDYGLDIEYKKKYITKEIGPGPILGGKSETYQKYEGYRIDGRGIVESLEKLDKKLNKVKEEVKKQIKDLAEPSMKGISKVLQNREKDIERKKSLTLSSDISKAVLKKIDHFNDKVKLPEVKETTQIKTVDFKVIEKEYECDKFAFNLYKMADKLSFKPLFLLRDKIIEEKQSKKVLVWGWNSDSMEYFEGYFLSDLVDKETSNISQNIRKIDVKHSQISSIGFVEEKDKIPLNIINPVDATIFVVINTYEIGRQSFRERFLNSTLWKLKEPNIVWVMDAVKEPFDRITDGDFCEEIKMFFNLIDNTDYAKKEIIVSSRFLYYTFIVNALRNKVPKWKTTSEKLDFNKQMVKIFKFNKHLPRLESYFSEFSKRRI